MLSKHKLFRAQTNTSKKYMQNKHTGSHFKTRVVSGIALTGLVTAGVLISPLVQVVQAQDYQGQINALNQQSAEKQGSMNQLGNEAASLQDTISNLQAQINSLQSQIQINDAKRVDTIAQIAAAEAELAHQKTVLSDDLKAMYVGGQMSHLEQLATSKNLSDFADQEQYKSSVQHKIQNTLKSINELRAKLATDKTNLERMIADLSAMRATVASQQAEQARLLGLNQAQQNELDTQIKANSSKIADLRKQQAAENARLFGNRIPAGIPGGGGYPGRWAFAPMDSIIDSWGMYNRECVSWTAFKVAISGRYMPYWGGVGNAKQWDDNARAAGIPVDGSPREGDVAVSNNGTWGHVMYVEQVASDGSIYVSDYNQQYDGVYRAYWITGETVSARGLVFIHF
jgi:surface antigen